MNGRMTSAPANRRDTQIRELEAKNQALSEVLQVAKRMLRSRRTLDDPFMMELDRAVNAVEGA